MVLDNDLLDMWLTAGMVGLDTERARALIEQVQEARDANNAELAMVKELFAAIPAHAFSSDETLEDNDHFIALKDYLDEVAR